MLQHSFANVLASLPKDLKSLPTLQGMTSGMTPPDPTPTPTQEDKTLTEFGDWTGSGGDTKTASLDLIKRGLIGADQIRDAPVDIKSADSIKTSQSDWKPAAIQQILINARRLNLRTPEQVLANKDVLISNPKFKEGVNSWAFNQVHKNFWDVIAHSILPEQWAKSDKKQKMDLAKK